MEMVLLKLKDEEAFTKHLSQKISSILEQSFNQKTESKLRSFEERLIGQESLIHRISALMSETPADVSKGTKIQKQEVDSAAKVSSGKKMKASVGNSY